MPFTPVYSEGEKAAVARAWCDDVIRPARAVCTLAANGELTHEGQRLAPFTIPEASVRDLGNRELRRRAGKGVSKTADLEPRDAVETLRRRLAAAIDHGLEEIEKQQRAVKKQPVDPTRIGKLARATRELAALPGPNDARPPAPKPGRAPADDKSLAGQLRKAVRGETPTNTTNEPRSDAAGAPPVQQSPQQHTTHTDTDTPSTATDQHNQTTKEEQGDGPGSRVAERFGGLVADRVTVASS